MLEGWLIVDTTTQGSYLTPEDLVVVRSLPFSLKFVALQEIDLEIATDLSGQIRVSGSYQTLPDFALVMIENAVQYCHLALLRQLEMFGVFSFHSANNILTSMDKFLSHQKLLEAGIPTPKTILMTGSTDPAWVAERIGTPLVIKIRDGSKGEGVCLVNSLAELRNLHTLYCKHQNNDLLAQEFIALSRGRDVRVTLCNKKVVFGVLRDNSGGDDFRSNISVGGDGVYWEPDAAAIALATRVVDCLDMKLCGVDLLFGAQGYLVGEINSMPGCLHIQHEGKSNLQRLLEAIVRTVVEHKSNVG